MATMDMPVFGAIDVGTNAVRLKLARRRASGRLEALHVERDPLRPGEGVFRTGLIPDTTVTRLVNRLTDYAGRCRAHGAEVRAVATSAMRDARNRDDVIARVRRHAGLELEIISGAEEARLTCLGVLAGTPAEVASLCIDIGGGSTEVAWARGERPSRLCSVDVGAFRLLDRVDPAGRFAPFAVAELRELASGAAQALPRSGGLDEAIACSGTLRALVGFAGGERSTVTRDEISAAVERLIALGPTGRRRHFEPRRADVVVTGGLILEAVLFRLRLDRVRAVKRGLRDGVLHDLARRAEGRERPRLVSRA